MNREKKCGKFFEGENGNERCVICGGDTEKRDGYFNGEKIEYMICQECSLSFQPDMSKIQEWYDEPESDITWKKTIRWLLPFSGHHKQKFRFLGSYIFKKGSVLDVGSAEGKFLYLMKLRGWNCEGVEPRGHYARFCERRYGIPCYDGFFEDFDPDDREYDLITMFETFEHMPKPFTELLRARLYLKDEGRIFFITPLNPHPANLYLFSPKSLDILFDKLGFKKLRQNIYPGSDTHLLYTIAKKIKKEGN